MGEGMGLLGSLWLVGGGYSEINYRIKCTFVFAESTYRSLIAVVDVETDPKNSTSKTKG